MHAFSSVNVYISNCIMSVLISWNAVGTSYICKPLRVCKSLKFSIWKTQSDMLFETYSSRSELKYYINKLNDTSLAEMQHACSRNVKFINLYEFAFAKVFNLKGSLTFCLNSLILIRIIFKVDWLTALGWLLFILTKNKYPG